MDTHRGKMYIWPPFTWQLRAVWVPGTTKERSHEMKQASDSSITLISDPCDNMLGVGINLEHLLGQVIFLRAIVLVDAQSVESYRL
jgi:hypothetical protein